MTIDLRERVTAIDPRLRARRIEIARDRGRQRLRRIAVAAVLSVVVIAGYGVSRSPLLDVDRLTIQGLSPTESTEVQAALVDLVGRPMVSVDPGEITDRVESMAWVADAHVTRRWPGTLELNVRARVAVAAVGEGPSAVAVDDGGRVLGPVGARDLPRIQASGRVPEPGAILGAKDRSVAALVSGLPDDLRPEVALARSDGTSMVLVLNDGIEVNFGDGHRLQAKATALATLLDQADRETMATIDVSGAPASSSLTRATKEHA